MPYPKELATDDTAGPYMWNVLAKLTDCTCRLQEVVSHTQAFLDLIKEATAKEFHHLSVLLWVH